MIPRHLRLLVTLVLTLLPGLALAQSVPAITGTPTAGGGTIDLRDGGDRTIVDGAHGRVELVFHAVSWPG